MASRVCSHRISRLSRHRVCGHGEGARSEPLPSESRRPLAAGRSTREQRRGPAACVRATASSRARRPAPGRDASFRYAPFDIRGESVDHHPRCIDLSRRRRPRLPRAFQSWRPCRVAQSPLSFLSRRRGRQHFRCQGTNAPPWPPHGSPKALGRRCFPRWARQDATREARRPESWARVGGARARREREASPSVERVRRAFLPMGIHRPPSSPRRR